MKSVEQPDKNVDVRMNRERLRLIEENRLIVKCCVDGVLFCARQGIALRGDCEKLDEPVNPGNFLAYLRSLANYNPTLKHHLENPRFKNAMYISPRIQNELIDIMVKSIIQKNILDDIRKARFYSIMADEVTSHNHEVMPLCIRFVDASTGKIREEFLVFSFN